MAKVKFINIEKDGNKVKATERQYNLFYRGLGYKQVKRSGGTKKKATKKDGE